MINLYVCTGGKCSHQAELSSENINITYKPDGTHIAVGNKVYVLSSFDFFFSLHFMKYDAFLSGVKFFFLVID